MSSRSHPPRGRGGPLTPFLVFAGIVLLSGVFFVFFTWPHWRERFGIEAPVVGDGREPAVSPSPAPGASASGRTNTARPPAPAGTGGKRSAPVIEPVPLYPKPEALVEAVTAALRARNLEKAFKIIGKERAHTPEAEFVKLLLARDRYRVPVEGAAWRDAGRVGETRRFEVKLEPASAAAPPPAGPLWLETERDRAAGTWRVTRLLPSPALARRGLEFLTAQGVNLDAAPLLKPPDALTRAHEFLQAVLDRDFRAALELADLSKLSQKHLAGLCIVFEEEEYAPAAGRPVTITASGDQAALALIRVRSARGDAEGECGLTLHAGPGGEWKVTAIDLNRLLETGVKAAAAKAGGAYYSPIVKNPKGGESLVVYFEFDSAELGPRARAQLDIVAAVLKANPARRLRITGHADELGPDDYNYKLSAARAKNVRERLRALGVDAKQIETIGFGATAPLEANRREDGSDNPAGRSRNRRTEIYLDF